MADSDHSSQDRTLEPTGKRLADARREGQVPRSRYLSHLMVLGTGVLGLSLVGGTGGLAMIGVGVTVALTGAVRSAVPAFPSPGRSRTADRNRRSSSSS